MNSIRKTLAILAIAIPVPAVIAGCGGGDDAGDEDPQTVLEETFNNDQTISSGNITMSADVSAEGKEGGTFTGTLSGPYQGNPENPAALPQFDWEVSASAEGDDDSTLDFSGGLVVTEDNAYVELEGESYEVGKKEFAQIKQAYDEQAKQAEAQAKQGASFKQICSQALEQAGGDASGCDVDPMSWLTDLSNEGTEDVGGAESVHISGSLDVEKFLTDVGEIIATVPEARSEGFDPAQLGLVSGAVEDASFDLYSTTDEHLLSKLEINLTVDAAAIGGSSSPVETVDVGFSVEVADINEEQTIEAPSNPRPLEELLNERGLEIPDELSGLGAQGNESGANGAGNTDAYLKCLESAETPKEIEKCASEL